MHLLVLTQNNIGAPKYGGALRVSALLQQLQRAGIELSIIRFRLSGDQPSPEAGQLAVYDIVVPRGYSVAPVAALSHLLSRQAEQLAWRWHQQRKIDMVQSDPPWAALSAQRIAGRLKIPHVLLSQNCETALAAQFALQGPARRIPLVGRYIANFNLSVLKWAEKRSISRACRTYTPSENDRQAMAQLGMPVHTVDLLPNGTNIGALPAAAGAAVRAELGLAPDARVAIFVGRLDYPPNLEALRLICSSIAPRCPALTFLLVGLNPPPLQPPANVRLIGAVSEVGPYLQASDLSIVPILQGSGTRIKILDSWAAGLPVLSTSAGAAGLEYREGVDILIEDQIEQFPARMLELLQAPALLGRLRQGALEAAMAYRWETIGQRYAAALQALATGM